MGMIDLGASLPINAAADTTGLNPGNLTTTADPSSILVKVGQYEIWHMVLTNCPAGSQARILYNGSRPFGLSAR